MAFRACRRRVTAASLRLEGEVLWPLNNITPIGEFPLPPWSLYDEDHSSSIVATTMTV